MPHIRLDTQENMMLAIKAVFDEYDYIETAISENTITVKLTDSAAYYTIEAYKETNTTKIAINYVNTAGQTIALYTPAWSYAYALFFDYLPTKKGILFGGYRASSGQEITHSSYNLMCYCGEDYMANVNSNNWITLSSKEYDVFSNMHPDIGFGVISQEAVQVVNLIDSYNSEFIDDIFVAPVRPPSSPGTTFAAEVEGKHYYLLCPNANTTFCMLAFEAGD